jgi:prepilin signal peptidase PulO-like enzyme (type II secretory pathway)
MVLLFLLLPLSSIVAFLIKDTNEKRMTLLNFFLIINTIVYVFPMAYAYVTFLSDGDMWNENGSGAILWVYTVLLPVCIIIQIILVLLKVIFHLKSRKKKKPLY